MTVGISFPVMLIVLYRWAIPRNEPKPDTEPERGPRSGLATDPSPVSRGGRKPDPPPRRTASEFWSLARLLGVGALMMALAYPMTFTTEPYLIYGRVTRNHFAAVIGYSIVVASGWTLLTTVARRELPRLVASALVALGFSLLLGFGQILQRSYVSSWESQKTLWREIITLARDAGNGTAIAVDPSGLDAGLHIGANSWSMPRVLEAIFRVPSDWDSPPSAYRMNAGWLAQLHANRGTLVLDLPAAYSPPDHVRTVTSSHLILITTDGGQIRRHDDPIEIDGHIYPLRPRSQPVLPLLGKRPLFDLLVPNSS